MRDHKTHSRCSGISTVRLLRACDAEITSVISLVRHLWHSWIEPHALAHGETRLASRMLALQRRGDRDER